MNPTSSYTFTSCPTECSYVDSQAYMQYSANQPNFHYGCFQPKTNSELTSSANKIHINPRICAPRNIYINRALYSCQTSVPIDNFTTPKKAERVYYNPKFFKNSSALTKTVPSSMYSSNASIKQEVNIHLNPNFFKKERNSATFMSPSKPLLPEPSAYNKPTVSSGIHINPVFLKSINTEGMTENIDPIINARENINTGSECTSSHTPRQKYVTKYKIVRKKISPAIINDPSVLKKANLKKINQTPTRKGKFKIVKGKCLKYISPGIANQKYNYINKYSLKRSTPKSKVHIMNNTCKTYPSHANQNFNLALKHVSYKKSILQQKIEARRRVKSTLNQNVSRSFLFIPKNNYRWSSSVFQRQFRPFNKISPKRNETDSSKGASSRFSSEFKSIGRMKLVRKSVLQKQIESRMHARKTPSNTSLSPRLTHPKKITDKVSMYKIVRTVDATPGKKTLSSSNKVSSTNNKIIKKKRSLLKFSSDKYRSEKLKKVAILTKKLRKNNQPCPLYHRFGRCKGKDKGTCPKLHDPKFIAICKRFLKGDCKDDKCTLSHDIRPEKMPTCYHYLAGLCKRTDCPYLHIKVNQKAPICRAFLQGFCADVFNCTKRHEFICPAFAEKGSCPRGKGCCLPHRTRITASKLLEPDEFPLLCRKRKEKQRKPKVSMTNECVSIDSSRGSLSSEVTKENKTTEFKRYFLALPPDYLDESNNDSDNETPNEITLS